MNYQPRLPGDGKRKVLAAALVIVFGVLIGATNTQAAQPAQGGSCTTGQVTGPIDNGSDADANNLRCVSSVWQYPVYQLGATTTACNASTAGALQWTTTSFQTCNGSSWGVLGGASLSSITAATGSNTIANGANAQTWNWDTITTGNALTLSSTSVTSGSLLTVQATNVTNGGGGSGVIYASTASNGSNSGAAVVGRATATTASGATYGGDFSSAGNYGAGIISVASHATGQNYGGSFQTASSAGTAIAASAYTTTGTTYGVYSTVASVNSGYGIYSNMTGSNNSGYAGYFRNLTNGGLGYGLYTVTSGGYAIYASAVQNDGIAGKFVTHSVSGNGTALQATDTGNGTGLSASSSGGIGAMFAGGTEGLRASGGTGYGISTSSASSYALYATASTTMGSAGATGYFYNSGSDKALYAYSLKGSGGMEIRVDSGSAIALYARTTSTSGGAVAGWFSAASGVGVDADGTTYGVNASASGSNGYGVYASSSGSSGYGVYGYASSSTGSTQGVMGRVDSTSSTATAVRGWASGASGLTIGVVGQSDSSSGYGVYGIGGLYGLYAQSTTSSGYGVFGYASGASAYGVYCNSVSNTNGCGGNRAWFNASDARLKRDIATLRADMGLDVIVKLRPVTYKWRTGNTDRTELGFIAQEVEKVLPQIVGNAPDAETVDDAGAKEEITNVKSLSYGVVTVPLVKAVQELKAADDDQAKSIERLKAANDNLATRVGNLEAELKQRRGKSDM